MKFLRRIETRGLYCGIKVALVHFDSEDVVLRPFSQISVPLRVLGLGFGGCELWVWVWVLGFFHFVATYF